MDIEGAGGLVEIRRAEPDDTDSIASVLYEAFREYKPQYTQEAFAATAPTGEQIGARFSEGPVWIATQNGIAVGTIAAVPKQDGLYIRGMAVSPAAQGQGVGELLLAQAENFARLNNFTRLYLSTTPFLLSAIRLYTRSGFQSGSEGPHELFGTPLLTMTKTLHSSQGTSEQY